MFTVSCWGGVMLTGGTRVCSLLMMMKDVECWMIGAIKENSYFEKCSSVNVNYQDVTCTSS